MLISAASITGDRKYQQDSYYYQKTENGVCCVICDGMGGRNGGEKASETAVEQLKKLLEQGAAQENIPEFYKKMAICMDEEIYGLTGDGGKLLGAGSTVVSAYLRKNELYWMSVGDSRIYIIRENQIVSAARPHNYQRILDESLEMNEISEADYQAERRKKDALTSYLGMGGIRFMEYNKSPFQLKKDDVILLCSDGLYRALTDEQIENIVEACRDNFLEVSDILMEITEEYGKRPLDNCTVIAIQYLKENGGLDDEIEKM